LRGGGECALGTLTSCAQTADSTSVGGDILLVFALEFLNKVMDKSVVKVLTTVSLAVALTSKIPSSIVKRENIERSSTNIEDENVTLASDLLVKTVGDCSSGGLVNDSENVEAGDGSGILGGLL